MIILPPADLKSVFGEPIKFKYAWEEKKRSHFFLFLLVPLCLKWLKSCCIRISRMFCLQFCRFQTDPVSKAEQCEIRKKRKEKKRRYSYIYSWGPHTHTHTSILVQIHLGTQSIQISSHYITQDVFFSDSVFQVKHHFKIHKKDKVQSYYTQGGQRGRKWCEDYSR